MAIYLLIFMDCFVTYVPRNDGFCFLKNDFYLPVSFKKRCDKLHSTLLFSRITQRIFVVSFNFRLKIVLFEG